MIPVDSILSIQHPCGEGKAPRSYEHDQRLFAEFLGGDDGALMELFDRHNHRLYLYCLKFVREAAIAEDLTQEIWERVIRLRLDGRDAPEKPVGLLMRIARNTCLNYIKARRSVSPLDELPESTHPTVNIRELSHLEELVVLALEHLPMAQREVLILNAYSGYRFDEIAAMLGEQVGTIRTRAWRARVHLEKVISAMIAIDEEREDADEKGDSRQEDA
jgi:RNA polymerase sigma factor (sigma-70 family)